MTNERMIPPQGTTDGLSDLRRKLAASRARVTGTAMTDQEIMDAEYLTERVAMGVVQGFEVLMTDPKMIDAFWERGYAALAMHSQRDANAWVGKRLWTALIITITVAGLTWLLRNSGGVK